MGPEEFADLGSLTVHVWVVPLDDPVKRRRRELAHEAERVILGAYLDLSPAMLEFATLPGGKPVLVDRALEFNISHSGQLALVAVSRDLPVGVDLEHPRAFHNEAGLARRICTARELDRLSRAEKSDEFLRRLWVRKEAVVKATGEGLVRSVNEIDVLDRKVGADWLCIDLPQVGTAGDTVSVSGHGYLAAVAVPCRQGVHVAMKIFSWEADLRH